MKKWIRHLLEKLTWMPPTQIVANVSPDYPETSALPPGLLLVVGGPGYQKWAYLTCPCGCRQPIMLSLSATRHPNWKVRIDWFNRPTIEPSIWQTDGCCSHFWVKRGRIDWVGDPGTPQHPLPADT